MRRQQHSPAASELRVFSGRGEDWTQALHKPLIRPVPSLPDGWSSCCNYTDANISLLKTLPMKGDSMRLEAEHVKSLSFHPSASGSAYPGCNPHCVNIWVHSPTWLWLITWSFKNSITQCPPQMPEVSFLQLAWTSAVFDLPGEPVAWFSL